MASFKTIAIEDKQKIKHYLNYLPQREACDYSFVSLYIWYELEKAEWLERDGYLLLRIWPGGIPSFLMPLAPPELLPVALETAIELANAAGTPFLLHNIPEASCLWLREHYPLRFLFEATPHLDDYIYSSRDLIELRGNRYHGKRNHINRFLARYKDRYRYTPFSPDLADDCWQIYWRWQAVQDFGTEQEIEIDSVRRALEHSDELELLGGLIYVDERPQAFALGEHLTEEMAVIHCEKATPEIPELYAMINREFAAASFSDTLWLNREEDLGLPGLQKAKLSYHPVRQAHKFRVRLSPFQGGE